MGYKILYTTYRLPRKVKKRLKNSFGSKAYEVWIREQNPLGIGRTVKVFFVKKPHSYIKYGPIRQCENFFDEW